MNEKINMRSGICPSCGSKEIYISDTTFKLNKRVEIAISPLKSFWVNIYLCTECGKLEEYMQEKHLKTESMLNKIKENWKKVT